MASASVDPIEIKRFLKPDSTAPSELRQLSDDMESVAISVEKNWDSMQPKLREALLAFAYNEPSLPEGPSKYATVLRAGLWFAKMTLRGEQDEVFNFGIAHHKLVDAILSKVESDNSDYQNALSESVNEAFTELERSESLEPEDTLDQLRQLSDEALK
jgi:hypothetical protein